MNKIGEFIFGEQFEDEPRYGIELEAENGASLRVAGWKTTEDGSLRNNGIEFISDGPRGYGQAVEDVNCLASAIEKARKRHSNMFQHNLRTSVHIHINVSHLNMMELLKLFAAYVAIEPMLFEKYGDGREYSPYCLPVGGDSAYMETIYKCLAKDGSVNRLREHKYYALSVNRLHDLGTVELRLFNGTNDKDTLVDYLNIAHDLQEFCRTDEPIEQFIGRNAEMLSASEHAIDKGRVNLNQFRSMEEINVAPSGSYRSVRAKRTCALLKSNRVF